MMLIEGCRLAELAVLPDGQQRDAAAAIISHQDGPAGPVDNQVRRALASRGGLIEQGELACLAIDREGADRVVVPGPVVSVVLVRRVEESPIGMDGQDDLDKAGNDEDDKDNGGQQRPGKRGSERAKEAAPRLTVSTASNISVYWTAGGRKGNAKGV